MNAAIAELEAQTEPYAYAAFLRFVPGLGWSPCDWDGRVLLMPGEHGAIRHGTNGENPMLLEILAEWDSLVDKIRAEYAETGEGMVYIAGRLMDRWPQAVLSDVLGRVAAGFEMPAWLQRIKVS
jgi:hypothetical protein